MVLDAGLDQQAAARAFKVSRSTVQRVVARARRAEWRRLRELLAEFDRPLADLLAEAGNGDGSQVWHGEMAFRES
jgi:transcriptional regulator with XRE-family HTH domain